jgi:hypothetical protein
MGRSRGGPRDITANSAETQVVGEGQSHAPADATGPAIKVGAARSLRASPGWQLPPPSGRDPHHGDTDRLVTPAVEREARC